jgi:hypothetical protein
MATCPLCRTKRNYLSLLFLGESSTLDCRQCGIFLRASANEARLLPYALITGSVAAILAFTVSLSADFVTTVSLLLAWTLISWSAYPFVLELDPDHRRALQSESK